jgi:uncharacterized protein (TIGR02284 family)
MAERNGKAQNGKAQNGKAQDGEVREWLDQLIEACKDGEAEFRRAGRLTDDPLRSLSRTYARQYAEFVAELEAQLEELGGRAPGARWDEQVRRGWIHLEHKGTGEDESCIRAEWELGEEATLKCYEEALGKPLPAEVRRLLERQYRDLKEGLERLRGSTSFA